MVEIKEKERAIIEFTCIPDVSIEDAQKLYEQFGFHTPENPKHHMEIKNLSIYKSKDLLG